jgi:hypothetical protein
MKQFRRMVLGYLLVIGAVFIGSYLILGLRESRLYLFLMLINMPSSLVFVPGMEEVAMSLDWVLGGPAHVWATQLVCMAANGFLLASLIKVARKLQR